MAEVGALNIDLSANSAKFSDGMNKAKSALSDFEKSAKRIAKDLDKFGKSMEGMGRKLSTNLSLPIAAVGAAIGVAMHKTAEYADEINNMAVRTGFSRESLQELKFAADQTGVSMDGIQTSAMKLSKTIGEAAQGNKSAQQAFQNLGISIKDAEGNLRPANEIFNEVIDALHSVENETTRNAIGMDIFGRGFTEITPLVAEGKDGLKNFADEARNAGLVMSEQGIKDADAFGDAMDKLQRQFEAAGQQIGLAFMPVIQDVLLPFLEQKVIPAIRAVGDWLNSLTTEQKAWGAGIAVAVAAAGPIIMLMGSLVRNIATLIPLFASLSLATVGWVAAIAAVGAAVAIGVQHFTRYNDIKNSYTTATKNAAAAAAEENVKLDMLLATAKNEKLSREERQKAIDTLQSTYPNYLSNINLENINTEATAGAVTRLKDAIINETKARAIKAVMLENETRLAKARATMGESELTWWDKTKSAIIGLNSPFGSLMSNYSNLSTQAERFAEVQKEVNASNEKLAADLAALEQGFPPVKAEVKKLATAAKDLNIELEEIDLARWAAGMEYAAAKAKGLNIAVEGNEEALVNFRTGLSKLDTEAQLFGTSTLTLLEEKVDLAKKAMQQMLTDAIDPSDSAFKAMIENLKNAQFQLDEFKNNAEKVTVDVSAAFSSMASNVIIAFSETMGSVMAGAGSMMDVLTNVLMAFLNWARNFGATLVASGVAALAAKKLAMNPATAIIAGAALVIASSAAMAALDKNPMGSGGGGGGDTQKFAGMEGQVALAHGGLIYGETLALIGEGPGTTAMNPEVVAPLDKLSEFFAPKNEAGFVEFFITGDNLRGVLNRNKMMRSFNGL